MLDSRHPSLSQNGQDGTSWVSHLMGWEAGSGQVLLPLVNLDLFMVLQELYCLHTDLGRFHCHQWGAQVASVGILQIFGVVR